MIFVLHLWSDFGWIWQVILYLESKILGHYLFSMYYILYSQPTNRANKFCIINCISEVSSDVRPSFQKWKICQAPFDNQKVCSKIKLLFDRDQHCSRYWFINPLHNVKYPAYPETNGAEMNRKTLQGVFESFGLYFWIKSR